MDVYYLPRIGKTFGSLDPRHIVTVTLWSYGPGTSPRIQEEIPPSRRSLNVGLEDSGPLSSISTDSECPGLATPTLQGAGLQSQPFL